MFRIRARVGVVEGHGFMDRVMVRVGIKVEVIAKLQVLVVRENG